jgi:hypothetical protein
MKLIHVRQARVVWLFELRDINPKGKDLRDVLRWIKETCAFAVAPDFASLPDPAKQGLAFRLGRFQVNEQYIEIGALTIFNDGIVVDTTSSTHDAELFAGELLESVAKQFGLVFKPEMIRRRHYYSELVLGSDVPLDAVNPSLAAFASRIGEAISDSPKPQFKLGGLSFWSEPRDSGDHKMFTFEREAGKFSSEKRYHSQAPLPTHTHLRLLEELERLLVAS